MERLIVEERIDADHQSIIVLIQENKVEKPREERKKVRRKNR